MINSSLSLTGVRTILNIDEYSGNLVVSLKTPGSLYNKTNSVKQHTEIKSSHIIIKIDQGWEIFKEKT